MERNEIVKYAYEAIIARWAIENEREKAGSQIAASLCRKYEKEMSDLCPRLKPGRKGGRK